MPAFKVEREKDASTAPKNKEQPLATSQAVYLCVFTRLWLNLLFLRHNLLTQSTGFGCCTRCSCITGELSRVLPTVSLTEDATAGTRVVLTPRGRPICNLTDCQTLRKSSQFILLSPAPHLQGKHLLHFPTFMPIFDILRETVSHHYFKLHLPEKKSIFLLLYQPYRFFLGELPESLAIHQ